VFYRDGAGKKFNFVGVAIFITFPEFQLLKKSLGMAPLESICISPWQQPSNVCNHSNSVMMHEIRSVDNFLPPRWNMPPQEFNLAASWRRLEWFRER
jgi:hypothetical protein